MKNPMESTAETKSAPLQPGLAANIQPFIDQGLIAGAVMLAGTKDKVLSLETAGWADLAARKPMASDSIFWIASMTKPMTATALMMLVDEGLVNVDDPVEKYLPEFKGQMVIAEKDDDHVLLKKPQHPILVREILNHTSGLVFATPVETPTYDLLRLEDRVRLYATTPLQFEPGTKYAYSNAGTNTVGRIIEVVSGLSYEVFMDRRLFGPLGMNDTTFWPSEAQIQRLAKIYRSKDDKSSLEETHLTQLAYPFSNPQRTPLPAGGLFSTVADCLKFCQMILNGGLYEGRRYISEASIREMTRKQTDTTTDFDYGFSWNTTKGKYGHGGAYKTDMTIDPHLGLITVFLIHHTNHWLNPDGEKIQPTFRAAAEALIQRNAT